MSKRLAVSLSNETFEAGAPTIHSLRIHSLADAQASCQCGEWRYVFTGERTKAQIKREYQKHIRSVRRGRC